MRGNHLHNNCEGIDAAVFSGDTLWDDAKRAELKEYIGRWSRAIAEHERADAKEAGEGAASELQQQAMDQVRVWAQQAVSVALDLGVVLTIEQVSVAPFAMGRYVTVVSVRPAREAA